MRSDGLRDDMQNDGFRDIASLTRSLTLTLRRSPLPDVDDDFRSTLLPTSEQFSELGIATTTTAAAAKDDEAVPPQIQI